MDPNVTVDIIMVHIHAYLNVVRSTNKMQIYIWTNLNSISAVNVYINFSKSVPVCHCVWILSVHIETIEI